MSESSSVDGESRDEAVQPARKRGGRRLPVVMGVVLALLLALGGMAEWRVSQLEDLESARSAALKEARSRVPLLLSYRASSLDPDLDKAAQQTTGEFARDYRQILDEVVRPTAARDRVSTRATVNASGIVHADVDEVVVLAFLTQTTATRGSDSPAVSGSRVEVTMRRVGQTWRIAGLDPR